MADVTKNIVNQYGYNSPYVKTLTEEQAEALYPAGIPVPKDLLLHIKNTLDSSIDYFIIGDGNNEITKLPKYGRQIVIQNTKYDANKIQFNDHFAIINDANDKPSIIGINTSKFPDATRLTEIEDIINDNMAPLLTLKKLIYDGNNKFNTDEWITEINNSTSYDKTNSFFLYNFLNCAYNGELSENEPMRFYSFCPFNLTDKITVKFYNNVKNQTNPIFIEDIPYNKNTNCWEKIKEDELGNNQYSVKVYFKPKTSLNNDTYSLESFYPYIYIESKDINNNTSINRNSVAIYITGSNSVYPLLSNADVYWITCNGGRATALTYFGTLNMSNNLIVGTNNSDSGLGIDAKTFLKYLKYYLLGEWNGDPTLKPEGDLQFPREEIENCIELDTSTNLLLLRMLKNLGSLINEKANEATVDEYYVKKPTTENKEGWTTLNGTGISTTDNKKIKYSFNVYDYKSQDVEN